MEIYMDEDYTRIDYIAQVCHEANRRVQQLNGEVVNFPWEQTSEPLRESARDGVRNVRNGATPEESHENWLKFKEAEGWTYGPVKDFAKKEHPCFVPYAELPEGQEVKDQLFVAIVEALG